MTNTSLSASSLGIFDRLKAFVAAHPQDRIKVRDLVAATGEHGLVFLLLVFALFCAVPLPIPGIHIFLSAPLFYVTAQQTIGRTSLWLPDKILDHTLPRSGFVTLITKTEYWFHKLDRYMKPRATWVAGPIGYRVMGAVAFFITVIIVIPLPLTNVVPSLSIALMALGMQCRDGVATLIGMTAGLLWCFAWIALAVILGWTGMNEIYNLVLH